MTMNKQISKEEAEAIETAYGKVLAHLKRARAEIEAMKAADTLNVTDHFRFVEEGTEDDIIYFAWRKIILYHPLMKRLEEKSPMKVEAFMWSIGLSDSPPITQKNILWTMEQIENRQADIEAHIQGKAGTVVFDATE